jgi:prophage regulatory protein
VSTHPIPNANAARPPSPEKAPPKSGLPATGFIRQRQLLSIIPVSPATLWRWVKAGDFVAPVRLGANVTAWRCEAVQAWMNSQGRPSA